MAATAVAGVGPGLAGLGRLLAAEPAVIDVLGRRDASLAVAESARPRCWPLLPS